MEEVLTLFAHTEVFIYVFIEIITKLAPVQRVLFKKAIWRDTLILVLLCGGFSIFGTYVGIRLDSGVISNIRDLGPIIAGVTAGPIAGLAAGLIGGVHRLFLGGFTCIPCSLATVLAGLIGGAVFILNRGKQVGIFQGMVTAIIVELVHAGITLLIARPFNDALNAIMDAVPDMMIANTLGMAIVAIIIRNTREIALSTE